VIVSRSKSLLYQLHFEAETGMHGKPTKAARGGYSAVSSFDSLMRAIRISNAWTGPKRIKVEIAALGPFSIRGGGGLGRVQSGRCSDERTRNQIEPYSRGTPARERPSHDWGKAPADRPPSQVLRRRCEDPRQERARRLTRKLTPGFSLLTTSPSQVAAGFVFPSISSGMGNPA